MLISYAEDKYSEKYVPTVFGRLMFGSMKLTDFEENYSANVRHKDKTINLTLWDTAGQEVS